MPTHLYALRCLTHLHAGSGDSGLGVIDKMVQRDPTDNLPTVFSSSLKGALREHFEKVAKSDQKVINRLFGAGTQTQGKEEHFAAGSLVFGEARLLSLPVRSDKHSLFLRNHPAKPDLFSGCGGHPSGFFAPAGYAAAPHNGSG